MKRGFKSTCEEKAVTYRQELGIHHHGCLPAAKLAEHLKIDLFTPHEIPDFNPLALKRLLAVDPDCWSALTIIVEDIPYIIHNSRHSPARREANLMHEMSHVVLKHTPISFKTVPGCPFPFREFRVDDEEEAKWLGGCLQIPRVAIQWAYNQKMGVDEISQYYGASKKMVVYRGNVTGIQKQFNLYMNKK